MEFDKSKVYTALNADELKIGSEVICANNIDSLKCKVRYVCDVLEVKDILEESYERRFQTVGGAYPFAYFVSEPPEKKKLKWTDLKIGDIICRDGMSCMITSIDTNCDTNVHVSFNNTWYADHDIEDWEKVEQ